MTRILWVCVLAFCCCARLFGAVAVEATVDEATLQAGAPVSGVLVIEHPAGAVVDGGSATLDGKPLQLKEVGSESLSGGRGIKTTYTFSLGMQGRGLQVLPSINIIVDGVAYSTVAKTYLVNGAVQQQAAGAEPKSQYATTPNDTWLKIENVVEGRKTLYPGQRTKVGYRYYFNDNIQLVEENLPLLEAEGFKKVGDLLSDTAVKKQFAMRQVLQEIEAVQPGEYRFNGATAWGYAYTLSGGEPQFREPKIKAETPPLVLTVEAFPEEGKPASFNGAIGDYTFAVRLLSLPEVNVGDKFTVSLDIAGSGELSEVPMPEICCQPGFTGNFKQSDIPPIGVVRGTTKSFVVDIRPMNSGIKAIPPVEFSFFSPTQKKYVTLRSEAIPVKVIEGDKPYVYALEKAEGDGEPAEAWPAGTPKPAPVEIQGNVPLSARDLRGRLFAGWQTLFVVPLGAFFLWFLQGWRRRCSAEEPLKQLSSADWMAQAEGQRGDLPSLMLSLERAFVTKLFERGLVDDPLTPWDRLDAEGDAALVRQFFKQVEDERFHPRADLSVEEILARARALYSQLSR